MRAGVVWAAGIGRGAAIIVALATAPAWAQAEVATSAIPARVEAERSFDPAAPQALGRVQAVGPTPRALVLTSSGGYGYTGSVLNADDAHHRAAGSIAVEGRPASWLGLGLRFDGRYDRHQSAQGKDDGWIGDPRVFIRADGALASTLRAGARLGIWFPGGAAPSVDFSAVTPELTGALTWAASGAPLWLTASGGYRLNRSARAAADAVRLSASDRLGLEISAFDQVLMGLGAAYGGGRAQGFAELSAEMMVGAGAPAASESPVRAGGGIRLALNDDVRLEAAVEAVVGSRPTATAGPLVPVPPRAAVWLGVAYRFGTTTAVPVAAHAPAPAPAPPPAPAPTSEVTSASRAGRVVAADGGSLSEARVTVQAGAGTEATVVEVDADGRFTVTGKPGDNLTIRAESSGYEPGTETVKLATGSAPELTLTLHRRLPSGQIRGLIRSFKGVGLDAEIKIDPIDRTLQAKGGRFEVDVAPGSYEVTITVPGYETQRRRVEVEQNGVTLLNADLRSAR